LDEVDVSVVGGRGEVGEERGKNRSQAMVEAILYAHKVLTYLAISRQVTIT